MFLDVKIKFDEAIKKTFNEKPSIRDYLLKHERKDECIKNLCNEIQKVESTGNVRMDQAKYFHMIASIARMWCKTALEQAHQQSLSTLKKRHIQDENERQKELQELFEQDSQETKKEAVDAKTS